MAENDFGVAIIGMAGRFPQADTVQAFWENLMASRECISFYSDEELLAMGISPEFIQHPDYVKAKGEVADIDKFDAAFFGIAPREAELTDPQHRVLLETAWAAFEDAGYVAADYPGDVGIFAGKSMDSYLMLNLMPHFKRVFSSGSLQAAIGNDKDSITTTIAYHLNLRGPAITVQTSSSTSLVAVCVACQSLLTWQCDMAIAGGVTLGPPAKTGYLAQEGGITASDGHCRAFSDNSSGFVPGTGAGLVVLKRVDEALRDGDNIYAVIKGFAVNNDGAEKISYTAPSVDAQARAIAQAQRLAGVEPRDITYVEAHGTGTRLGDPVEFAALSRAFGDGPEKQYCALGSVKTNIGHLDTAAGVTGLIKTALAVHHGKIPATLHFERPNAQIDLAHSPFYINTQCQEWRPESGIRKAGVTSLGMGGTNAHVVVEQAPEPIRKTRADAPTYCILSFSARTDSALSNGLARFATYLQHAPLADKRDVAWTLAQGRKAFTHRVAVVSDDLRATGALLAQAAATPFAQGIARTQPGLGLLFSGQGSQYQRMGHQLYGEWPVYAAALDRCADILARECGLDIRHELFTAEVSPAQAERLAQTRLTQPLLFSVEYALAQLWLSWGIRPAVMIGHSLGEWVAATLAGVFSLDDALRLVARRAELMHRAPTGAMLMVALPEAEARALAQRPVALAAVNSPGYSVLSGPDAAIHAISQRLTQQNVINKLLHTSHAFHSSMMQDAAQAFRSAFDNVRLNPPSLDIISTATGARVNAETLTTADYWIQQMLMPVQFSAALRVAQETIDCDFLEVGPGATLTRLANGHALGERLAWSSLPVGVSGSDENKHILETVAALWTRGHDIDWSAFAGDQPRRVSLPTYQFDKTRYWIPSPEEQGLVPQPVDEPGIIAHPETRASRQPRPAFTVPYAGAETETQRELLALCETLLGIDGLGIDDNFFEAGGHSLMLGMLLAQIQETFAVTLSFIDLMEDTSVRALARLIDQEREASGESTLATLVNEMIKE
ncbi:colibactin polyketide synthase ClbI [Klebsiella grimontii]|uniref:colibactin polyketide synthase ClbI n=1 Tax=Klebsiella grimontii TaxID=2058152 RepID=UPI00224702D2|nr:colibactin polyketide synthase ClbI [Klebsiella grimontii]MCW9528844.1 colibactin polyketide synthase ClbI [Klebsiella grimontii]